MMRKDSVSQQLFCGTAFHVPRKGELEVLDEVGIVVADDGAILRILAAGDAELPALKARARAEGRLTELKPGQFLMPGLVDLHIHAPQWPQLGKALDAPLETWLQQYTFPLEAKYQDIEFARTTYDDMVATLLANGTTTAVYFATIHVEASVVLAQICLDKGQRAFVGKVAMDNADQCPDYYRDADAATALADTQAFIERLRSLDQGTDPLVRPIITPRFIPSCTDELLEGLGRLAREYDCPIQTHCSESDWEKDYVIARFGRTDAQVLADHGLLRDNTILAHSNFVDDPDLELIRSHGAGVAHCPLSNAYFANAVFPLRTALDRNVRVGLGTDISGGYSPSVLDSCRHAMLAGRMRESGIDPSLPQAQRGVPRSRITVAEAFWLATAGGGEAVGLKVGKFEPGYKFDAIVVDIASPQSNIRHASDSDSEQDLFEKIVLNANRANIAGVWVNGTNVRSSQLAESPRN